MSDPDPEVWTADRGRSFGAVADLYAASRPGYPADAVRWVAAPRTRDVLDLGAGTGKLTEVLVDAGYAVTAVEPLPQMLDRLRIGGVRCVAGRAERIPLRDRSFDAVFAGQAFHWFQPDQALPEIARVLRPGGRLGLLWNLLDTSVSWVAELAAILHEHPRLVADEALPPASGMFPRPQYREFRHPGQLLDLPALLDLVRSRSYIATLPAGERAAVLARVSRLVREHADLAGRERFEVPYGTHTWRATLASR